MINNPTMVVWCGVVTTSRGKTTTCLSRRHFYLPPLPNIFSLHHSDAVRTWQKTRGEISHFIPPSFIFPGSDCSIQAGYAAVLAAQCWAGGGVCIGWPWLLEGGGGGGTLSSLGSPAHHCPGPSNITEQLRSGRAQPSLVQPALSSQQSQLNTNWIPVNPVCPSYCCWSRLVVIRPSPPFIWEKHKISSIMERSNLNNRLNKPPAAADENVVKCQWRCSVDFMTKSWLIQ